MKLVEKNYEEAKQYFTEALKIQPNDTVILLNLGKVAFAKENYDEAKNFFERIIETDALNAQAYYMIS